MKKIEDHAAASQELIGLLRQQKQCYQELTRLAEQQRALIRAERSEELLTLLTRRQKVVDTIGKLHQQLGPYRENWNELKEQMDPSPRRAMEDLLAELEKMLNDLLEHDQEDCRDLSDRKQQIAEQLTSATRGRAATAAYGGQSKSGQHSPRPAGMNLEISG